MCLMFVGNRRGYCRGETLFGWNGYGIDWGFGSGGVRRRRGESWALCVNKGSFGDRGAFLRLTLRLRRRRIGRGILEAEAWVESVDDEAGIRSGNNVRLMLSLMLFQGEIGELGHKSCFLAMEQREEVAEVGRVRSCFDT